MYLSILWIRDSIGQQVIEYFGQRSSRQERHQVPANRKVGIVGYKERGLDNVWRLEAVEELKIRKEVALRGHLSNNGNEVPLEHVEGTLRALQL